MIIGYRLISQFVPFFFVDQCINRDVFRRETLIIVNITIISQIITMFVSVVTASVGGRRVIITHLGIGDQQIGFVVRSRVGKTYVLQKIPYRTAICIVFRNIVSHLTYV